VKEQVSLMINIMKTSLTYRMDHTRAYLLHMDMAAKLVDILALENQPASI